MERPFLYKKFALKYLSPGIMSSPGSGLTSGTGMAQKVKIGRGKRNLKRSPDSN
jgi:hypothetical protein